MIMLPNLWKIIWLRIHWYQMPVMTSSKRICCRAFRAQETKFDNTSTIAFLEWMAFKAKNAEMIILRIRWISKKVNLKFSIMLSTVKLYMHKDHEVVCPRIDQTIQFHRNDFSNLLNSRVRNWHLFAYCNELTIPF